MGKKDPRVDAYIAKANDFAKPILIHLRELVHKGCPEIEETWKWSFPNFVYNGILCNMAAFREHCTFGFWKAALLTDPKNYLSQTDENAMGQFGRITSLKDLPPDKVIISFIKEAAKLNETGAKIPKKQKKTGSKELSEPGYFSRALKRNKNAATTYKNFSYSQKKEYLEWITEAKTEETRNKRMATAIKWMAEGKPRNWKYMKRY